MSTTPRDRTLSRRTVLVGAAATGIVTSCGATGSASPSQPAGGSQGPGVGLVATSQVPLDGGTVVTDSQGNPIVVVQPSAGKFLAYSAVCPHAGCPVSQVQQNQILCPCHGSVFSSTDGSVLGGPAPSGLTPITVTVSGGEVVTA